MKVQQKQVQHKDEIQQATTDAEGEQEDIQASDPIMDNGMVIWIQHQGICMMPVYSLLILQEIIGVAHS